MEIKHFGSRNEIVLPPTFSGSIAAAGKKPMQHGEINGPLNVKVVPASFEQRSNYLLNPPFFPGPPKHQVRPHPQPHHDLPPPPPPALPHSKPFPIAPP